MLLPTIPHFFFSTTLLLSLISTAVVLEAQENVNGEGSPLQYQEATGLLGIEEDVDDQRSAQFTSDDRSEEKHESTGSGFVSNAVAAGVGTLLASGIANYGSNYGYPYTSAYVPGAGAYFPGAGSYIPGAGIYSPGSYIPGAGAYMPGSYVPGAGAYIPMANAPAYGVMSTGYRPQTFPIYGDQEDSNAPADSTSDLTEFSNSYPGYYSELVSGNPSPKRENELISAASTIPSEKDDDSSVAGQQNIRITGNPVRYPIDWSAVAHDYYRSMAADPGNRPSSEAEDMATVFADSYPLNFEESDY